MQSLWMTAGALAFAAMAAAIKLLAAHYSPYEIVFWRGVLGVVLLAALAGWRGLPLFAGPLRLHARRSIIGTAAMLCWVYALGFLPLGTGMTLNYTSPLFMAAIVSIAMWHRGERQASQGWLYATIVSSFAGVVLILQPGGGGHQAVMPTLIGLFSGLLSAFAYFQLRSLSRYGEPEWRIVFWFSVVNCVMSAAAATVFDGWHPVAAADLGGLLAVGVLALVGQLCLTRAFSYGRTLLSANLQYSGVVFAALIGWLVFDERLDGVELAGIVLVVVSSAAATVTSVRRDPVRVAAGPGDGTAPGAAVPGGAVPASSTAPASEIAR